MKLSKISVIFLEHARTTFILKPVRHLFSCLVPSLEMPKPKLREFGIGHVQSHLVSVSQCCRARKGFTRSAHRISGEDMKPETPSPLLRPFTCPAARASRLTSPLSPQLRHLASTSCLTNDGSFSRLLLSVVDIGGCQDAEDMKARLHQARWIFGVQLWRLCQSFCRMRAESKLENREA